MPKKLNDTQVLEKATKHANGTSISTLAKDFRVSRKTVGRYINNNADLLQKCTGKKRRLLQNRCYLLF